MNLPSPTVECRMIKKPKINFEEPDFFITVPLWENWEKLS